MARLLDYVSRHPSLGRPVDSMVARGGLEKEEAVPFRNGDLYIATALFFFLIMCLYVLARCYFLAESLASIRSLSKLRMRRSSSQMCFRMYHSK
jgi:hypothetical protein